MTKTVTYKDAEAMLLELAQEFPDRFVRRCTYALEDGQPNCLIGVALARWGVPTSALLDLGRTAIKGATGIITSYVTFTEDAVELLGFAQIALDTPVTSSDFDPNNSPYLPWGEAVRRAFVRMGKVYGDGPYL